MYNGIGLTTPRGSGTNGHVQRNWAFVRPGKKDNITYKSEDDLARLDATTNKQPNQGILDHERKRKVEVKCAEFEDILEKQGYSAEEVYNKVESYRAKLIGQDKEEYPKDEFGRILVRETHQIAKAQQEKNMKLRDAFGISQYFVEGSSFDSDRKAKEDLAKSNDLQTKLRDDNVNTEIRTKYALVKSPVHNDDDIKESSSGNKKKKKKNKRHRSSSDDEVDDNSRKKKSKKRSSKKEIKKHHHHHHKRSSSGGGGGGGGGDFNNAGDLSDSDLDKVGKKSKKSKKSKKV